MVYIANYICLLIQYGDTIWILINNRYNDQTPVRPLKLTSKSSCITGLRHMSQSKYQTVPKKYCWYDPFGRGIRRDISPNPLSLKLYEWQRKIFVRLLRGSVLGHVFQLLKPNTNHYYIRTPSKLLLAFYTCYKSTVNKTKMKNKMYFCLKGFEILI